MYDLTDPHVYLHDSARIDIPGEYSLGKPPLDRTDHDLRIDSPSHRLGEVRTAQFRDRLSVFVRSLTKAVAQRSDLHLQSPADFSPSVTIDKLSLPPRYAQAAPEWTEARFPSPQRRATFFTIHTGGAKVASIEIMRVAYHLGESIPVAINFHGADGVCYGVYACLETVEEVSTTLALRSEASISRATRRVHAQTTRHTHCSEMINLELVVPRNATPEFTTTGIKMKWNLRFSFATTAIDGSHAGARDLLEPTFLDDRGQISSGMQEMGYENLDVTVPVRVFGSQSDMNDVHKTTTLLI